MFSLAAYEYHRNKTYMRVIRRNLRDSLDPFDIPDERFREMYRFPRSLALSFLDLVSEKMDGSPCPGIPVTIQFCSVLNFYASGSYQRRVGSDAFAMMSQSLVSKCVRAFSYVITKKIMDQFVQFPQTASEIQILHDELQKHFDYPGAFAIVDGSLIGLAAVSHLIEHVHVCRKSFHAINAQFICDVRMLFLSVNARYPGLCHDALIWRASLVNSHLRRICNEMGEDWCYYLLADNGYPLQKWLLKPYDSPNTPQKQLYNKQHKKVRSLVERAIGLLKARFRCLLLERKLRYDPVMSGHIIYACTVLHNYLIRNNYPVDEIEPLFEDYDIDSEEFDDIEISYDDLQGGVEMRNEVAQYFTDNSF